MVKHTQRIRRRLSTNCLSVFNHSVGLALKGLRALYTIFWYTCTFLITFSGFFWKNMNLMLYIFWKNEVCSFQNWQNPIQKFKWGRTWVIRKCRIWSLCTSCSPPIINIYRKFLFQWMRHIVWQNFVGKIF